MYLTPQQPPEPQPEPKPGDKDFWGRMKENKPTE